MKKIVILGCNDKTRALVPMLVSDPSISPEICISSRDKAACDEIKRKYAGSPVRISTARVDLSNETGTKMMLSITQPDMIVHLTEAKYSMTIMKLALEMGAAYIDCALDSEGSGDLLAKQFELFGEFRAKGITAITGCGFNPGLITTLVRNALNYDFNAISQVDLFEIEPLASRKYTLKEILFSEEDSKENAPANILSEGQLSTVPALSEELEVSLPGDIKSKVFIRDNVILDDFAKELPEFPNVRYFASFAKPDTSILDRFRSTGMLSTTPIEISGVSIAPVDFLAKVIEAEGGLSQERSEDASTEVGAGAILVGKKNGTDKKAVIYIGGKEREYEQKYGVGFKPYADAVSMFAGISLVSAGRWKKAGVFTPCAFEPDIMMNELRKVGFEASVKDISDK